MTIGYVRPPVGCLDRYPAPPPEEVRASIEAVTEVVRARAGSGSRAAPQDAGNELEERA